MTPFWETTSVGHNMDNQLQAWLTLLSLLTAVVKLNSAFYNDTTAYMRIGHKLLFKKFMFTPACACRVYVSGHMTGVSISMDGI